MFMIKFDFIIGGNTMNKTCKIEFSGDVNKNFCYRSGTAVYEETFVNGMLIPAGYNFWNVTIKGLEQRLMVAIFLNCLNLE